MTSSLGTITSDTQRHPPEKTSSSDWPEFQSGHGASRNTGLALAHPLPTHVPSIASMPLHTSFADRVAPTRNINHTRPNTASSQQSNGSGSSERISSTHPADHHHIYHRNHLTHSAPMFLPLEHNKSPPNFRHHPMDSYGTPPPHLPSYSANAHSSTPNSLPSTEEPTEEVTTASSVDSTKTTPVANPSMFIEPSPYSMAIDLESTAESSPSQLRGNARYVDAEIPLSSSPIGSDTPSNASSIDTRARRAKTASRLAGRTVAFPSNAATRIPVHLLPSLYDAIISKLSEDGKDDFDKYAIQSLVISLSIQPDTNGAIQDANGKFESLLAECLDVVSRDTKAKYVNHGRQKNGRIEVEVDSLNRDRQVVERYHELMDSTKYRVERMYRNSEAAVRYVWTREDFVKFKEAFRRFGYAPTANRQIAEYVGKGMHPNHIQYFKRALKQRLGGQMIRDLIESPAYDELVAAAPADDGRGLADFLPPVDQPAGTKILFGSTVGGSFFSPASRDASLGATPSSTPDVTSTTPLSSAPTTSSPLSLDHTPPAPKRRGRPPKPRPPAPTPTEDPSNISQQASNQSTPPSSSVPSSTTNIPAPTATHPERSLNPPSVETVSCASGNHSTAQKVNSKAMGAQTEQNFATPRHMPPNNGAQIPVNTSPSMSISSGHRGHTSGKRPASDTLLQSEYKAKRRPRSPEPLVSSPPASITPDSLQTARGQSTTPTTTMQQSGTTHLPPPSAPASQQPSLGFAHPGMTPDTILSVNSTSVPSSDTDLSGDPVTLRVLARLMKQTAELQEMVTKLTAKNIEQTRPASAPSSSLHPADRAFGLPNSTYSALHAAPNVGLPAPSQSSPPVPQNSAHHSHYPTQPPVRYTSEISPNPEAFSSPSHGFSTPDPATHLHASHLHNSGSRAHSQPTLKEIDQNSLTPVWINTPPERASDAHSTFNPPLSRYPAPQMGHGHHGMVQTTNFGDAQSMAYYQQQQSAHRPHTAHTSSQHLVGYPHMHQNVLNRDANSAHPPSRAPPPPHPQESSLYPPNYSTQVHSNSMGGGQLQGRQQAASSNFQYPLQFAFQPGPNNSNTAQALMNLYGDNSRLEDELLTMDDYPSENQQKQRPNRS